MAQQYYSMDQIAKLAQVSQQQVYYLINMKFKFKPTLTDPSGNKFYDERAVGQIFQDLGKTLPKSVASPATENGLLDINAIAETTGIGKKKLRTFIREHKELKPDFIDEKNHNKKYWGPSAIQYINDHFGAEEEPKEPVKAEESKPVQEVIEAPAAPQEPAEAEKTAEEAEAAPAEKAAETAEKTSEEKAAPETAENAEKTAESKDQQPAGPRFVKKAPRPASDKLVEHPQVELPFAFDDTEEQTAETAKSEEGKETKEAKESKETESAEEARDRKETVKGDAAEEKPADQQFVVRKRNNDERRARGNYKHRSGQRNGYQNRDRNNYSKRRELFAGKMKLVTEKGTFYTDQFASLEELAEYVLSAKGEFMKVEKYNRGEFSPAYISTKSIIEFEEA
ncbi:hypothetical protein lacNasYZ03_12660 [Lactobacillus nasalidis]|uniref:HTH merR-type domain-containing protein n=1 Tax=Lactobacillus nasalidis TaxID=2797258 RepID=A0ABQ3W748_9LACO|nr:hypothetical protein [Lactobacillus nasalidis]GHV97715.1 hypothetical protein lacNasYZ01_08970 [Lactobacillus nasalidis]GHV99019.1 hypothetical protein lacNasYZ02_04490 [Lactobacillus nasalidis]GHW01579.1 hypothetical protein lacNasYZ03_12660 [Lactobacillus nasalidis]